MSSPTPRTDVPPAEPSADQPAEPSGSDETDSPRSASPQLPQGDPPAIDLILHTPDTDPPLIGWLDTQFAKALQSAGVCSAQLSLVVVADPEMAELHEQYTGVAGTTDVLTFDLLDPDDAEAVRPNSPVVEGDIVVCLDEAQRQSAERGHPVRYELLLYAVHGLMHLLGEDDHDEAAYQQMHAREDALLTRMGIGPVFNPRSDT